MAGAHQGQREDFRLGKDKKLQPSSGWQGRTKSAVDRLMGGATGPTNRARGGWKDGDVARCTKDYNSQRASRPRGPA